MTLEQCFGYKASLFRFGMATILVHPFEVLSVHVYPSVPTQNPCRKKTNGYLQSLWAFVLMICKLQEEFEVFALKPCDNIQLKCAHNSCMNLRLV